MAECPEDQSADPAEPINRDFVFGSHRFKLETLRKRVVSVNEVALGKRVLVESLQVVFLGKIPSLWDAGFIPCGMRAFDLGAETQATQYQNFRQILEYDLPIRSGIIISHT